jgi:hypothetical protein
MLGFSVHLLHEVICIFFFVVTPDLLVVLTSSISARGEKDVTKIS